MSYALIGWDCAAQGMRRDANINEKTRIKQTIFFNFFTCSPYIKNYFECLFLFSPFAVMIFERMRSTRIVMKISVESAYISGFTFFLVIE